MQFAPEGAFSVSDEKVKLHPYDKVSSSLDDMIAEYQIFHDRWIEGLKKFREEKLDADRSACGRTTMNGDADIVAVWGLTPCINCYRFNLDSKWNKTIEKQKRYRGTINFPLEVVDLKSVTVIKMSRKESLHVMDSKTVLVDSGFYAVP